MGLLRGLSAVENEHALLGHGEASEEGLQVRAQHRHDLARRGGKVAEVDADDRGPPCLEVVNRRPNNGRLPSVRLPTYDAEWPVREGVSDRGAKRVARNRETAALVGDLIADLDPRLPLELVDDGPRLGQA